jgi:hypothetical protein
MIRGREDLLSSSSPMVRKPKKMAGKMKPPAIVYHPIFSTTWKG